MKTTLLKKYHVFFFTMITFLFVFARQDISGTNELKFPGNILYIGTLTGMLYTLQIPMK